MATETKRAVRLRPKTISPPDPHAEAFRQYRGLALRITRTAIERYLTAKADYDAVAVTEAKISSFPPSLTTSEREEALGFKWSRWDQSVTDFMIDAENFLLHAIVNWDQTAKVDTKLEAYAPRGVIRNGVLYLALPDDPDKPLEYCHTQLYIVPMTSIVDLDPEGGDR